MESVVHESTQQMLVGGKCVDFQYPDPQTATKQCWRTSLNTKFVVGFNSLTAGVNTLTIPPNNGISDVLVQITLTPPLATANVALPQGWGYSLINRLSYRAGGSSQFFLTGQQVLNNALRLCPDGSARDAMLQLGGPAIAPSGWGNPNNLVAYVWLSLPWAHPSAVSKMPPLPSDCLTQQIQIQLEINNIAALASVGSGGVTNGLVIFRGDFYVQQVQLSNQGDSIARRMNMTENSLNYPLEFTQQEFAVNLGLLASDTAATQTVSLTGFRSGEVKEIICWLTCDVDTVGAVKNYNKWYSPRDLVVSYAGDQYARYDKGASQLWNLINGRIVPQAALSVNQTSGGSIINQPSVTQWAVLPFAQPYETETYHTTLMSGKEITNGIVQLQFTIPYAPDAFSGAAAGTIAAGAPISGNWTIHFSYVYNSVLVFSQGTCDFAF
jgi:hypothetical protein